MIRATQVTRWVKMLATKPEIHMMKEENPLHKVVL